MFDKLSLVSRALFVRTAAMIAIAWTSACGSAEPATLPPAGSSAKPNGSTGAAAKLLAAIVSATPTASASATPEVTPVVEKPPSIGFDQALDIAYAGSAPAEATACKSKADEAERIRCLLRGRFAADDKAQAMAIDLYDKLGMVTGVAPDQIMDGGWRGEIHLVPELPVGQYRRHLQWVKSGFEDIDAFFAGLDAKRAPGTRSTYRFKALALRFMRSVGRTTPSAYAIDWEVAYNVSGSLHANAAAVRETLFHEIFHTNDQRHGHWSTKALAPIADAILERCGQKTACLTPYAPGTTMVRGGTYYAFQQGNGVGEYAAELATRYFLEHRAILEGKRHDKGAFKCGPPENAKAWRALVDEFFGVDLVPECPAK